MNNKEQQQTKKGNTPTNKYQKEMLDHKVNPPPKKKKQEQVDHKMRLK